MIIETYFLPDTKRDFNLLALWPIYVEIEADDVASLEKQSIGLYRVTLKSGGGYDCDLTPDQIQTINSFLNQSTITK